MLLRCRLPALYASLLFSLLLAALAACPAAAKEIVRYVAPAGKDTWSGTLPAPNAAKTDGPFATLERARDALRSLSGSGTTAAKAIELRGGAYERAQPFALTSADSGLTLRPYKREVVRLIGGRAVSGWAPVTDAAILDRLDPAARGHVLRADLRGQGITDDGRLTARGFSRPGAPAPLELFWNGQPMTLARWPNVSPVPNAGSVTNMGAAQPNASGWATIASAPAGPDGGKFTYDGDRPARWKGDPDIWLHGYWTWDWADSYEHVAAIDPATKTITTDPPHGIYGYTPGKRWYALNVLEELDTPGEYYVDRGAGILYFWPPSPPGAAGRAVVSLLEGPLVQIAGAKNVTLRGMTLEDARGNGVEITDSTDCLVADGVVRNLGEAGVVVRGGARDRIAGCAIYAAGDQGILLSGGDRATLTPCGHEATGCDIHDYSRWDRTYRAGVGVDGVGIRVTHCHIHNAPHNAILMSGNDNLVAYNEIDRVCQETGDAGAFYIGRDWSMRGNVVRANWFHDMDGVRGQKGFTEVMAVYLDDCASGTTVEDNIFQRIHGRAIMVGGGRDNHVLNNLFVACRIAVHVDARAQGWAKAHAAPGGDWKMVEKLEAVHYDRPPYSTRYPELARMLSEDPSFPKGTRIEHNVVAGTPPDGKWIDLQNGLTEESAGVKDNLTTGDVGLLPDDPPRLRSDSPAYKLGFHTLPVGEMGQPRTRR